MTTTDLIRALTAGAVLAGVCAFPTRADDTHAEPEEPETSTPADAARDRGQGVDDELAEAMRQRRERHARQPLVVLEPEVPGNLLEDPGFEGHLRWDEAQPWWNPLLHQNSQAWVEFDVAEGVAHTGQRSAHLHMDSESQPGGTRVHGVVQEHSPSVFPRYISGWYRVENWQRGAVKQYLQAVIAARNPTNTPAGFPSGRRGPSVQLAMTLAGVDFPPLRMGNRRFEVTGPVEPVEEEWVFFEFNLHELYEKHWSMIPENAESLRIFFEVRYDHYQGSPPARADVYFDDLYLGDESRAGTAEDGC